ncbi:MAG: thioredoxin family protein [Candidatus Doudnabacteria bacterium]
MKALLPYILIVIVLLAGGGLYLQLTRPNQELLNVSVSNSEQNQTEQDQKSTEPKFSNKGPAPEFVGVSKWLNSDALKITDLKGKVVLVDFWTYSCINCIRTLPYVTDWYEKYKNNGLVVVGVHTPEFAFEKVTSNVQAAIERYKISYPVAQDNNYKTWQAYDNRFWPAHYLIDKDGNIMYTHFGEGQYEQTEKAIRTLLGLEGDFVAPLMPEANQAQTPEIYLGTARLGKSYGGVETPSQEEQIYTLPPKLSSNKFALEGKWQFSPEAITHTNGYAKLKLNFNAANAFMVAESPNPVAIKVWIDGVQTKGLVINKSDLYTLFESSEGGAHTLEIEVPEGGLQIFTFTFG